MPPEHVPSGFATARSPIDRRHPIQSSRCHPCESYCSAHAAPDRRAPGRLRGLRQSAAASRLASLIPVKGKVTYKGQPLTKGSIRFEPDGYGRPATGQAAIRRDVRADARSKDGDGVVAGHTGSRSPASTSSSPSDRALKKYASREYLRA